MKKLVSFLFLCLANFSFAYMSINPVIFDKRIDNGGAKEEFFVSNPTKTEVGYRVYVEPSDNGEDMSKWIEFYPTSLKLKPGETKKINVFIEAPEKAKKGEYTGILGIKEITVPNSLKNNRAGVNLYTDLKIELAGFVGELKPKLEINDLKLKNKKLSFNIKNIGEIRTKVEAYIEEKGKDPIYLDSFRILQNKEKSFEKELSTTLSKNSKLIIYDLAGKKVLEKKM